MGRGRFYRGNLHCHTTCSDGAATPAERIADYRAAGYDFLAITDHGYYDDYTQYNDESFLVLPGVELDCGPNDTEGLGYHIVGIALPDQNTIPVGKVKIPHDAKVNNLTNFLHTHGHIAITAHPYWLQMTMDGFMKIEGTVGLEIFNSICHFEFGTGFSESYYDHALLSGKRPLIFASDDYHGEARRDAADHFTGYIMVKAPALTHKDILDAILAGNYYASYAGPEILDFAIRDGKAVIDTAPCHQICLRSPRNSGRAITSFANDLIHAEIPLSGDECYIRAVVYDDAGHCSWTQTLNVTNKI